MEEIQNEKDDSDESEIIGNEDFNRAILKLAISHSLPLNSLAVVSSVYDEVYPIS